MTCLVVAGVAAARVILLAQSTGAPFATLAAAAPVAFPNEADSNSPAIWEMVEGRWRMSLLNSVAGQAKLSEGRTVQRLTSQGAVSFRSAAPHGGVWFESVIRDADAWYGFYHNEREGVVCAASGKVWPRIGAARSDDLGRSWIDLGPILETPPDTVRCETNNHYFVGGVGDFSAVLDPDRHFVYLYYTQYVEATARVGVSVARMAWADRDAPAGRVDVWAEGVWQPPALQVIPPSPGEPTEDEALVAPPEAEPETEWRYPLASPIMIAGDRWDNGNSGVNVFWGPSIHWNTAIDSYVMLLNQAASNDWKQGGVFVSFNPRLDDPGGWSAPVRLFQGGYWYPQVIGLADGVGTDTIAGPVARFFMNGRSDFTIVFGRR
ncbi:MAG: hypothetical protein AB7I23_23775 [Vicinamibacterales bacterium]